MDDLAQILKDAQTLANDLSTIPELHARAKKLADDVGKVVSAVQRVCATDFTETPALQYSLHPDPRHVPGMLPAYFLRVCQNVRPAHSPGIVYEALVDRLAGAFLAHYFPATHQFLLQPQHTFRREAPDAALRTVGDWSVTAAPSQRLRADLSGDTEVSDGSSADADVTDASFSVSEVDMLGPVSDIFFEGNIENLPGDLEGGIY
ncbi:hypothetical protein B0H10DRAFT_1963353 [Mycena sp. CBHHK59/15]|nr:hypothetical protein B0H10DRAFT_1963353 [Mycena sp. CBHHK59/15]